MNLYSVIDQFNQIKNLGLPTSFIICPEIMFEQITEYVVCDGNPETIMKLGEIPQCQRYLHLYSDKLKQIFFKSAVVEINNICKNNIGKELFFGGGAKLFVLTNNKYICEWEYPWSAYICKYNIESDLKEFISKKLYTLIPTEINHKFKIIENTTCKID